jgi:hypothetical protein
MRLGDLAPREISRLLASDGLVVRIGPFSVELRSEIRELADPVGFFYRDYPVDPDARFADFHIRIDPPAGLRRWIRPQVVFDFDGQTPFERVPRQHAFAVFEWGLNWVVANNAHQYLILHAAVVERGGEAMILPGEPGAGKSTLCAALVSRGWRLLSDEMTVIDTADAQCVPIPRPVSLKNDSIGVIRRFAPQLTLGGTLRDTTKGEVAYVRAPDDSVVGSDRRARARWVVFPRYAPDAETTLTPESSGKAFMRLATQAFNYSVLGSLGFDLLGDVVSQTRAFDLRYSDLHDAVERLSALGD